MELPSKELFSAVTGVVIASNGMAYDGYSFEHHAAKLNIYELANKCKEWAFKEGYTLSSGTNNLSTLNRYSSLCEPIGDSIEYIEEFAETEPEAIFAACQWILDNKDK